MSKRFIVLLLSFILLLNLSFALELDYEHLKSESGNNRYHGLSFTFYPYAYKWTALQNIFGFSWLGLGGSVKYSEEQYLFSLFPAIGYYSANGSAVLGLEPLFKASNFDFKGIRARAGFSGFLVHAAVFADYYTRRKEVFFGVNVGIAYQMPLFFYSSKKKALPKKLLKKVQELKKEEN